MALQKLLDAMKRKQHFCNGVKIRVVWADHTSDDDLTVNRMKVAIRLERKLCTEALKTTATTSPSTP